MFHNPALAEALWGRDGKDTEGGKGQTWEYMFALDELRPLDVPYAEFNKAVGDKPGNNHQGFRVLDPAKSVALLEWLPLASQRHMPLTTEDDYEHALDGLTDLDEKVIAKRRIEQAYLRGKLFPSRVSTCDLCGREFGIDFLVAAHIKKRAACTDDERKDVPNIVMAACRFGCDELFERGYISVADDGSIVLSSALQPGATAEGIASQVLSGRVFEKLTPARQSYFEWHRTHSFRG